MRTRGGWAVLPSSWIIVASWIMAIVFTVVANKLLSATRLGFGGHIERGAQERAQVP